MAVSKFAPDPCLDALLDYVAGSTEMIVCSGTSNPADRAAALSAALTVTVTMTGADFTKSDAAGRKVTIAAKDNIEVTVSGDATCIVLCDGAIIRYINTCTTKTLYDGQAVFLPSWDVSVGDPT